MENVLDELRKRDRKVIKHGQLYNKILLELKMMTSFFEYIEINTTYHDDKTDQNLVTWVDIEGMGYGWIWARYDEKDWFKMMLRLIYDECEHLTREMKYVYYFLYEYQDIMYYHFVIQDEYCREDRIIKLSNEELWG